LAAKVKSGGWITPVQEHIISRGGGLTVGEAAIKPQQKQAVHSLL